MRNFSSAGITSGIALLCMSFGIAGNAQAQSAAMPWPVVAPLAAPPVNMAPLTPLSAPAASVSTGAAPRPVDSIIVVVNDDVITSQELAERMAAVQKRLTSQGMALPPQAQLRHQLLERLIVERAQIQMAKENGILVDDTMVDRAVSRIAEQNKLSMPQFRIQLQREGVEYAKFREDIRREIIMQRLREREVDNKVVVTESEIDNYLSADKNGANTRQELDLAQILIRVPENASADQIKTRRQHAEDILNQLKSGADFAKLAATYSESNEALNGGDLGWRSQDRLPQLFLDATANLKPGEVSGIVKSGNGFHIVKLIDRRASGSAQPGAAVVQQTHVRHILIKVNQVVTAAEARRKLLELKERLDNHAATFEDLAKLYSNDLSAAKGGDLGWVYPGDTVPEFERAMNELKLGEVSQPIESPFGYHLIQVVERKSDDGSPERTRQSARLAIRERKIDEAAEDWLRQLRDRTYVEYRTDQN